MFWVEGLDRFSYEWYLVGTFKTREEAEARKAEKEAEQEKLNGKNNPIGDVYFVRENYWDVRSARYA